MKQTTPFSGAIIWSITSWKIVGAVLIPKHKRLYLKRPTCVLITTKFFDSSSNSICKNASDKSIWLKIDEPDNLAKISSGNGKGYLWFWRASLSPVEKSPQILSSPVFLILETMGAANSADVIGVKTLMFCKRINSFSINGWTANGGGRNLQNLGLLMSFIVRCALYLVQWPSDVSKQAGKFVFKMPM